MNPGGEPGGHSSRVLCPEPPAPTPRLRGLGASRPRPAGIGSTSSGWHRLCPGPAKCGRLAWPWPAVAEVEGPLSPRARSCGGVTGAGQALASGRGLPQGGRGAPFTYPPWPPASIAPETRGGLHPCVQGAVVRGDSPGVVRGAEGRILPMEDTALLDSDISQVSGGVKEATHCKHWSQHLSPTGHIL